MEIFKIIVSYVTLIAAVLVFARLLVEILSFYRDNDYSGKKYFLIFEEFYFKDKTNYSLLLVLILVFFIKFLYIEIVIAIVLIFTYIFKKIKKEVDLSLSSRAVAQSVFTVVILSVLWTLIALVVEFSSINALLVASMLTLPIGLIPVILLDVIINKKRKKKKEV